MKEKIRYFVAGIFIGLSELLPGISGATVALMFGVYEKILNFLTKLKELNFILPLLLGMLISVFTFSSFISFLYENFSKYFNISITLLMIGYGLFLLINTALRENIIKDRYFYLNVFLAILIGFSLSGFHMTGLYTLDGSCLLYTSPSPRY